MEKKITSDSTVVHSLFQVFNINGSKVLLSICLMLIAVFVSAHAVLAQGRTVSGTVTEAGGEGLPGVNIMIKGTGSGTVTDVNGKYSVEVSSENDVLVFSFVGYLTQEMTVGNQRIINVELPVSQAALDEIVVIGYGTRKKSSVTSSVTRLENRGLEQIPDSRVENVLAGRLAGVNISNARSRPGEAPNIRVRGLGSISAGNNPLIVVDGFPGGDLGTLNMNDVESIEVLKDASAAAIYGSRGASGVILVTTKRGKEGKTSLNVNSYFGISKAMLFNDWLTGKEWYDYLARYQNREFVWAGGDPKLPMFGDAARPDAYKVNPLTYELPQTIWQDEVMQTGRMQSYNVSASGGSDKGKYYVSGVYQDEEGSMKTANYRKIGVRANVDMKINSFINMGMELSPSYTKRRLAGSNMVNLVKYPPFVSPQRLQSGKYPRTADYIPFGHSGQASPYVYLYGTENFVTTFNNIGRAFLDFRLAEGLTFKTSVGTTFGYSEANNWAGGIGDNGVNTTGSIGDSRFINTVNENILNYTKTFNNDHDFGGLLGASYQKSQSRSVGMAAQPNTFANDIIKTLNNAQINPASATSSNSQWGLISYFARVNYAYKGKYLVEGSIRRDGSSRFGPDNKWGNFPSASVAWRVSEESFLKGVPSISELKLKASYGVTGNFNIGDFQYLGNVSNVVYSPGNVLTNGKVQTSLANSELSWEKTKGYNIGFELNMFNNRFGLTVDHYNNRTTDMLYSVNIPGITGFTNTISNTGTVENRGIDVEFTSKNFVGKDFRWNTSLNVSHNKNEVIDIGGVNERVNESSWSMAYILRKGVPMFSYYGYKMIGVFQNEAQIESLAHLAGTVPGNPIVEDVNGDGKIDQNDRVVLGNFMPKVLLGFTNEFSYKNLDVSFFIQGSFGAKMFNVESQYYEGNTLGAMRRSRVENQWWSEAEPGDGMTPALSLNKLFQYNTNTDYYLENASFVSLRSINLGYNFPQLATKLKMSNLKLYGSINNLILVKAKGNASYNPEGTTQGEVSGINSTPGMNLGSEPLNRTFVLGLNLGF